MGNAVTNVTNGVPTLPANEANSTQKTEEQAPKTKEKAPAKKLKKVFIETQSKGEMIRIIDFKEAEKLFPKAKDDLIKRVKDLLEESKSPSKFPKGSILDPKELLKMIKEYQQSNGERIDLRFRNNS